MSNSVMSKVMVPLSSLFSLNFFPSDKPQQPKAPPLTHVIWIDCSGSMWDDLPLIREHLKNKLATLVRPEDKVSLGWFSGTGQFGFIQERVSINDVNDLKKLQDLIDRFLRPQGLTSFNGPIEQTVSSYTEDDNISFLFLTDGHHNSGPVSKVLDALQQLKKKVVSAAIVGYGWYYNQRFLQEMAETVGGSLLLAEDFPRFEVILNAQFSVTASKRTVLSIPDEPYKGTIFSINEHGPVVYKADENNQVTVSEGDTLYWITKNENPSPEAVKQETHQKEFLAALSVLVNKGDSASVKKALSLVGEKELLETYSKAIGKQALVAFNEMLVNRIKNNQGLYNQGFYRNIVIDEKQYCLMDFLEELANSDSYLKVDSPHFVYKRAGVKMVDKPVKVFSEEKYLELVKQKLGSVDPNALDPESEVVKDLKSQAEVEKLPPKFEYVYPEEGVSVRNLVFNGEIPNVSINVKLPVVVKFEEEPPYGIPQEFYSYKYKNYMVIKSGITNVKTLVLRMPKENFDKWVEKGLIPHTEKWDENTFYLVNLEKLPITNISRTQYVSCQELAEKEVTILNTRMKQKVYKYFIDKVFQKSLNTSASFAEMYTAEGALWLKEQGITDYSGYNPKKQAEESGEVYQVQKIVTSIKGCSSEPAVKAVLDREAEGKKLNYLQNLILEMYRDLESEIEAKKEVMSDEQIFELLQKEAKDQESAIRKAQVEVAQTKASLVLGQTWFVDRENTDDNKATVGELEVTFKLSDEDVAI